MTVAELGDRMSSRELTEWIAYDALEPFGEQRADLRQAITSSLIYNVNRGKGTPAKPPTDFMPYHEAPTPEAPSPETLREKFMGLLGKKR